MAKHSIKRAITTKQCVMCGEDYQGNCNMKYCSDDCRNQAQKACIKKCKIKKQIKPAKVTSWGEISRLQNIYNMSYGNLVAKNLI